MIAVNKILDSVKPIINRIYNALQLTGKRLAWITKLAGDTKKPGDDKAGQLDEKEEQLALANALSSIVLSSSDLNELCEGFASELRALVPIDWAAIGLIDNFTDGLRLSPLSVKISSTWELGDNIPMAGTPVEWLVNNQQAMLEPDLKTESRFRTGAAFLKQGLRSMIYMPLFSRKEIFGSLIAGSRNPNAYMERELRLLKYTTTQLALAIENSRLFRESREVMERESKFITTLSHELKTPLTPIRASGELLAEEFQQGTQTPQAKLAENILRSAYSLDSKLTDMLELAKVQPSTFKLKLKQLDIKPLIEEVVVELQPTIESKQQSLHLELPPSLPPVKADKQQLKRVLVNLLSNAATSTPKQGSIALRAKKRSTELVVEIEDSGEGFPPEVLEHLFEVYHTPEADRQRPLELRLGLALCKRLVELHRGRIRVESEVGKGSTFAFSIPLD